jgi:hypothetical protein
MRLSVLAPFVPMSAVLALSLGAAATIGGEPPSPDGRIVAAFFDPRWSAERAFAAVAQADGAVVGEGALRTILTAHGGGEIKSALYRQGAWLVIDAPAWACGGRVLSPSS